MPSPATGGIGRVDAYDIVTIMECPVDVVFLANAFHGLPEVIFEHTAA